MFDGIFGGGDDGAENQDQPMTDAPTVGGMGGDMPDADASDDMGGEAAEEMSEEM